MVVRSIAGGPGDAPRVRILFLVLGLITAIGALATWHDSTASGRRVVAVVCMFLVSRIVILQLEDGEVPVFLGFAAIGLTATSVAVCWRSIRSEL